MNNPVRFAAFLYLRPALAAYNGLMQNKDALETLNWLIEAGADEAIGEAPVNRLVNQAAKHQMEKPVPLTHQSQPKAAIDALSPIRGRGPG